MCLLKKDDDTKLMIVISTHVDDSLIGGQKNWVEHFYNKFSKHFKIEKLETGQVEEALRHVVGMAHQ